MYNDLSLYPHFCFSEAIRKKCLQIICMDDIEAHKVFRPFRNFKMPQFFDASTLKITWHHCLAETQFLKYNRQIYTTQQRCQSLLTAQFACCT